MKHFKHSAGILFLFVIASALLFSQAKDKQSFPVGKNAKLEVTISGGDIIVKTWEKSEISIQIEGLDPDELESVKISNSESGVRLSYRPRSRWNSGGGSFTFTVPSQTKTELKTSGGNIELQGALTGDVTGSTSGGDIRIERVKGKVEMKTSGGNVKVDDIDGQADLSTSGGDIRIGKVNGEADVSTSGGDIRIESVGKRINARTSGGDIEVGDVGGDARLSTAGGDVRVGKVSGSAILKTSGGDLELRGASGTVEAKTAGGDIDLQNISGSINASTAGGNVKATLIPSGKGSSELKTAGGDIKLTLPENAKATIEATIQLRDNWGWGKKERSKKYKISSDFKADNYDEREDEIHAVYKLNGGGEAITLETSNGNIDIRKK